MSEGYSRPILRPEAAALALLGLIFVTGPVFFERLHSDEVIYWEVARNIANGMGAVSETTAGGPFLWHMPLPFYINSVFLSASPHIFTSRVVSSLFTVGTLLLVYLVAARRAGRGEAFVAALFFLVSFQALRFGGRFYLDQYGAFFFMLSFFLVLGNRPLAAGAAAMAAGLSREYWLGVYPFIMAYLWLSQGRGAAVRFALPAAALLAAAAVASASGPGLLAMLPVSSVPENLSASISHGAARYGVRVLKGWAEFAALNAFISAMALAAVWRDRLLLILVLPQLVAISLAHGFVLDGGVTQYPLPLAATLAALSGQGLARLRETFAAIPEGRALARAGALAAAAQFALLNLAATAVTRHENPSIYALGFWDDRQVISVLRQEAGGKVINGIHGAFVETRARWDWTDYLVQEAIDKRPDWLVTFRDYVEVTSYGSGGARPKIYEIGPYLLVGAPDGRRLGEYVRAREGRKWALSMPLPAPVGGDGI